MWTLFTLLLLVGVIAYFMFFWSPDEAKAAVVGFATETHSSSSKTGFPSLTFTSCTPMQIRTQLTKTDYSKFRRYTMFRLRKAWLVYVAGCLIFTYQIFLLGYGSGGTSIAFALLFSLLIAIAISAFAALLTALLVKILPDRPGTVLGSHTFTLTDSEFQEANAAGSASVKLEFLRRHETRQHIFLFTPMHAGHILPMQDLQANPEFLRMLRARTRRA